MILLDKPYVSDFLKQTITRYQIPVVNTPQSQQLNLDESVLRCEPSTAIAQFKNGDSPLLYTNSENAINWIVNNLAFTDLPQQINLLKDKAAFRELSASLFPNFYYKVINIDDLAEFDVRSVALPFVIKPAVGFFSMAVYKVASVEEWPQVLQNIFAEMRAVESIYPEEVLGTTKFIIEECIEGDEFAIDAYYNSQGQPVIIDIYQHLFASDKDVSDRVYFTSKSVITRYKDKIADILASIGHLASLKNFPAHAEVRIDDDGNILPIEINPMRFGGWCATDLAHHAYGINPYQYYFEQKEPDWDVLLRGKDDVVYSLIVLDNSTGIPGKDIKDFDYQRLLSQFEKPLELRQTNYRQYPVFAFLFTETRRENMAELEAILQSDLTEFVRT